MDNVEDVEDDYLDIFWTSNDLSFSLFLVWIKRKKIIMILMMMVVVAMAMMMMRMVTIVETVVIMMVEQLAGCERIP